MVQTGGLQYTVTGRALLVGKDLDVELLSGGRRRMDRVLDPEFMAGMTSTPAPELRERRDIARQEETDLSYLCRLLQGRIAIVAAELVSGETESDESFVDRLTSDLAMSLPPQGGQAPVANEPSRIEEHQRYAERLVADVGFLSATAVDSEKTALVLNLLKQEERSVSELRSRIQNVIHTLTMELGSRYRTGQAALRQG
jgi:hypothetical protein